MRTCPKNCPSRSSSYWMRCSSGRIGIRYRCTRSDTHTAEYLCTPPSASATALDPLVAISSSPTIPFCEI